MQNCTTASPKIHAAPIYSTLASDPDLSELVDMFVSEIPDKISALRSAYDAADWELLRRTAHQLKGAVGSYGFDCVTQYAFALEHAVREQDATEEVSAKLAALTLQLERLSSLPTTG